MENSRFAKRLACLFLVQALLQIFFYLHAQKGGHGKMLIHIAVDSRYALPNAAIGSFRLFLFEVEGRLALLRGILSDEFLHHIVEGLVHIEGRIVLHRGGNHGDVDLRRNHIGLGNHLAHHRF